MASRLKVYIRSQLNELPVPRNSQIGFLLSFLLLGLVAYSNILNSFFLSDDFVQIGGVLQGNLSPVWGQSHGGFFRPIFILSYFVDLELWGTRPLGFHLTNVSLHALNAFLSFVFSFQLIRDFGLSERKRAIALGAGFLFLLHPSHTEAVTWISGRADVLTTLFGLSSLIAFLCYIKSKRFCCLAVSLVSFALALLTKESAISIPFLMIAISIALSRSAKAEWTVKHALRVTPLFILLLLVFLVVRFAFLDSVVGGYGSDQHLNFSPSWLRDRFLQASLRSLLPAFPGEWASLLLNPLESQSFRIFSLVCAGLIVVALVFRHKSYDPPERKAQNCFLLLLVALFLFSLLPTINLRLSLYQTQGERFVYFATVFSSLAVAYVSAIIIRHTRLWLLTLLLICAFYVGALYKTNQTWQEAAQLSRNILDDLVHTAQHQQVVIINAPDNLQGVPIYRNGLVEAVRFFQQARAIERVDVVALHNLQSPDDEIDIVPDVKLSEVELALRKAEFTNVNVNLECVGVLKQSSNDLRVRLNSCAEDADLFCFSKGRMMAVRALK